MAFSLRGCGVVLKSDIEKRDKAFAKIGRTPHEPVVSSLFIHSRSSYSLGSHVGVNPKSFEPITDPFLSTFMAPQRTGTNLRMAFLPSTKDKAVRKAFDADAEYGLNFTVASNWKKAAKETIFGRNATADQQRLKSPTTRPMSPTDDLLGQGRDMQDLDNDPESMWRSSAGGVNTVLRGRTLGERRQMTFTADGNTNVKAYSEMDARIFFKNGNRGQSSGINLIAGAGGHAPAVVHTLQTVDPLSDASPFARGRGLRSRPSSAKSRVSVVSEVSRRDYDGMREGLGAGGIGSLSERGIVRGAAAHLQMIGRPFSARRPDSARASSPISDSSRAMSRPSSGHRPTSGRSVTGGQRASGFYSPSTRSNWTGTAGENGPLEIVGRELEMPTVSFEDDPAIWYEFAQRCFSEGHGDLARRALRALEGDEALQPASKDVGMNLRRVYSSPKSPPTRPRDR